MWPSVPLEGAICALQNSKKPSNSPKKLLIYEENGRYLCVLMSEAPLKVTQRLLLKLRWSRFQTPSSHEEKRSGEPSWISWASAHFCNSVTYIVTFKNI